MLVSIAFCLLISLAQSSSQSYTSPRFAELAKSVSAAISQGAKDLPHSLSTDDILHTSVSGEDYGIDHPLLSDQSSDFSSLRGPHKPIITSLIPKIITPLQPLQQQQQQQQMSPGDDPEKMNQAWKTFLRSKKNTIPPLEETKEHAHHAIRATPPHIEFKTPHDLTVSAMTEYDAHARSGSASRRAKKDDTYMARVEKLERQAYKQNQGEMAEENSNAATSLENIGSNQGDAYKPHAQHFGFKDPMDFIDSFDPFTHDSSIGERKSAPPMAAPPSRSAAPPLPSTNGNGGGRGANKEGIRDLGAQILDTTPTYEYTKIGNGAASSSTSSKPSVADGGIFATNDATVREQIVHLSPDAPPPREGSMGRSAIAQTETDSAIAQMMTSMHQNRPVATSVRSGPV